MKKLIFIGLFFIVSGVLYCQDKATVEKSQFNVQAGLFGIWINNEARLSNNFSLKTELGLRPYYVYGDGFGLNEFGMVPSVGIEPRFHYNLQRRIDKGKEIRNNASNFISLSLQYLSDNKWVGGNDNIRIVESILIVPTYGFKRNFSTSSNFTYEFNAGFGIAQQFLKQYGFSKNEIDGVITLRFVVGYTF